MSREKLEVEKMTTHLVRYTMHDEKPLILKEDDEHLGVTVKKMDVFEVKATVIDDEDDGRWHEEIVFAEDGGLAEEMFRRACKEFGYEIIGNLDVEEPSEEIKTEV